MSVYCGYLDLSQLNILIKGAAYSKETLVDTLNITYLSREYLVRNVGNYD